ncbi:hypothetical protein, no similarity [Maudiozyma barnettii]|uniref:pH-response transcription factor pacC/RIM101 n=1 Tax=Maudiozyma barnettii TaxID=61262 RepID=A0A8H2VD45_9SACH|nr:hypothetical protein, no similarity [Kazachstania barnettii]CAB4253110.1 hypothetical protein, no similarity [Kazachstania barnettii]CAD1780355.1 hypothetical protein, no similarity [Kazachstania barnettii]
MIPQSPFGNQVQKSTANDFDNIQPNNLCDNFETTPFFSNIFVNLYDNVTPEIKNSENNIVSNKRSLLLNCPLEKVGKVYSDGNFNLFSSYAKCKTENCPHQICNEQKIQLAPLLPIDLSSPSNISFRHNSSTTSLLSDEALYLNSLHNKIGKTSRDSSHSNINAKNIQDYLLNCKTISLKNNTTNSPSTLVSSLSRSSSQCSPSLSIAEPKYPLNQSCENYNDAKLAINSTIPSTNNKDSSPKATSPKGGTHCCKICGKNFQRPSTLDTHMNIHSGEKPYVCPFLECEKLFNARSNMLRHLKMHFKFGKGKYLLPSGEVSSKKPTAKQLVCFTNLKGDKISQHGCIFSIKNMMHTHSHTNSTNAEK